MKLLYFSLISAYQSICFTTEWFEWILVDISAWTLKIELWSHQVEWDHCPLFCNLARNWWLREVFKVGTHKATFHVALHACLPHCVTQDVSHPVQQSCSVCPSLLHLYHFTGFFFSCSSGTATQCNFEVACHIHAMLHCVPQPKRFRPPWFEQESPDLTSYMSYFPLSWFLSNSRDLFWNFENWEQNCLFLEFRSLQWLVGDWLDGRQLLL